jgi:hypothetical protein
VSFAPGAGPPREREWGHEGSRGQHGLRGVPRDDSEMNRSTRWYVDRVREPASHRCLRCGEPLVWVESVGWVDSVPGEAYDLCDADPFGNHVAGPLIR